jgi:O-antigen/teichoic acid export membrane protein
VGEPDVLASREAGPAALRGGAMRTVGYVVGILVTLASAPILIRHLGVADFGRYTTVVALLAVVGGITEGGLNAIAQREYVTLEGERRTVVMRQLLGIRVLLTAAGVALATVFGLVAGYDDVLVLGTLAGGLGLLLAGLQGLLTSVLQARLRFGWATVIDLIRQVATAALIIGLAVAGASLLPFFAVPIAAGVVALVLTVWLVRGFVPLRPAFRLGEWLPLVRDTLPYAIATALNAAYFRVAIILMSLQATALQTGYYATAFRVVEVLIMVPVLGVGAAFPILTKAAKDDASRFDHAATRILELALIAGVWMALVLGLGAQVAIDVLADDAQPAVAVLRLQGLALIPAFLALGAVFPLLSLHRYRAIMVANGVALLVAVALTLALVPGLEARGAALATTLAELTSATIVLVVLIRAKPALASVVRSVPAVALAAAAGAAAALLPGVPATADVAIGSVAFLAVLAATGRFPPEVRHALRRRVVRLG